MVMAQEKMDFQRLLKAVTWYCEVYEQMRPASLNGDGAWMRLGKYIRLVPQNEYCVHFYYGSSEREKQAFTRCFDAWRRGDDWALL